MLVVDDCRSWGQQVAAALGIAGWGVDWVATLDSAVDRVTAADHALVIVGMAIGRHRAADVAAALRSVRPSLRVAIAAREESEEHWREAALARALPVPKSLPPDALRAVVAACTER